MNFGFSKREDVAERKPIVKSFPTKGIIVHRPKELWSVDLMETKNDKISFRYVLIVVDAFSRKAMLEPMYSKNAVQLRDAMHAIILKHGIPDKIQIDKEAGFQSLMYDFLKEKGVKDIIFTHHKYGSALSENFIGQLRNLFNNYDVNLNKENLKKIENKYNGMTNKTTQMTPNDANVTSEKTPQIAGEIMSKAFSKVDNAPIIKHWFEDKPEMQKKAPLLKDMYEDMKEKNMFDAIKTLKYGDIVKIPLEKTFVKGHQNKWRPEEYIVVDIKIGAPIMYGLYNVDNGVLSGRRYREELYVTGKSADQSDLRKGIEEYAKNNKIGVKLDDTVTKTASRVRYFDTKKGEYVRRAVSTYEKTLK